MITILGMAGLVLIFPSPGQAGTYKLSELPTPFPTPSPTPDPLVTITQPQSYAARKIFLFPLELPSLIIKGATLPLLGIARLMERNNFFVFTPKDWILLPLIQAGGGWGFGGGIFFQYNNLFKKGYRFRLHYRIFTDLDQRGGFSIKSPPDQFLWDHPYFFNVGFNFKLEGDDRFFGIGADSLESNRTSFDDNQIWFGANVEYFLLSQLSVTLPVAFFTSDTGPGTGNFPSIQTVFPPDQTPGFEQRFFYLILGLELAHDTRNSPAIPSRGGLRAIRYYRWQGLNTSQFDFNEFELEVRQFFELWTPRHVLALRNAWQFQVGDQIPFYLLSTLDWHNLLRGFTRGRFRDEASVVFNFEYRFPVWDYINGTIFVDTGKVFPGLDSFNFDNWRYSVGGGIDFFIRDYLLFRLLAGYGGEGAQIIFNIGPSL